MKSVQRCKKNALIPQTAAKVRSGVGFLSGVTCTKGNKQRRYLLIKIMGVWRGVYHPAGKAID
jgi:hypothetical protein